MEEMAFTPSLTVWMESGHDEIERGHFREIAQNKKKMIRIKNM